jgi:hypothetical protein
MVSINEGLAAFSQVHAKYVLSGSIGAVSTSLTWPRDVPKSSELFEFYSRHPTGIKFETGFTPRQIINLEKLEEGQTGYLWSVTASGNIINPSWPKEYVVFMDSAGGNPVIAVVDQDGTPVCAAYDAIKPFRISDTLGEFFLALSKLIAIVYGEFNIFDIGDDDGLSDIFISRLTEELLPTLGQDNFERFVDYFYG